VISSMRPILLKLQIADEQSAPIFEKLILVPPRYGAVITDMNCGEVQPKRAWGHKAPDAWQIDPHGWIEATWTVAKGESFAVPRGKPAFQRSQRERGI